MKLAIVFACAVSLHAQIRTVLKNYPNRSPEDEALLHRLLVRRGNMLQAAELAQKILADAGQRNLPRPQLTGQFQTLANSLNHWYLPPEQQVGRDLYQSIAGKLIGLPDVHLGEAFPPTEFVNREVAELGRLRTVLLQSQPSLASR